MPHELFRFFLLRHSTEILLHTNGALPTCFAAIFWFSVPKSSSGIQIPLTQTRLYRVVFLTRTMRSELKTPPSWPLRPLTTAASVSLILAFSLATAQSLMPPLRFLKQLLNQPRRSATFQPGGQRRSLYTYFEISGTKACTYCFPQAQTFPLRPGGTTSGATSLHNSARESRLKLNYGRRRLRRRSGRWTRMTTSSSLCRPAQARLESRSYVYSERLPIRSGSSM